MTKEELKELQDKEPNKLIDFGICPECLSELVYQEGCAYCIKCGWSLCK